MDKSKITKSLAVFASVLLIIIIGVASFAYFGTFNVNLNNKIVTMDVLINVGFKPLKKNTYAIK